MSRVAEHYMTEQYEPWIFMEGTDDDDTSYDDDEEHY